MISLPQLFSKMQLRHKPEQKSILLKNCFQGSKFSEAFFFRIDIWSLLWRKNNYLSSTESIIWLKRSLNENPNFNNFKLKNDKKLKGWFSFNKVKLWGWLATDKILHWSIFELIEKPPIKPIKFLAKFPMAWIGLNLVDYCSLVLPIITLKHVQVVLKDRQEAIYNAQELTWSNYQLHTFARY